MNPTTSKICCRLILFTFCKEGSYAQCLVQRFSCCFLSGSRCSTTCRRGAEQVTQRVWLGLFHTRQNESVSHTKCSKCCNLVLQLNRVNRTIGRENTRCFRLSAGHMSSYNHFSHSFKLCLLDSWASPDKDSWDALSFFFPKGRVKQKYLVFKILPIFAFCYWLKV